MDLEILNNLNDSVAELLASAEQQGLLGMQEACMVVQQNIPLLMDKVDLIQGDVLECFVPLAQAYLEVDSEAVPETVDLLLDCLGADVWPMPLPADYRESLREILIADKANAAVVPADTAVDAIKIEASTAEQSLEKAIEEQPISQELIDMLAGEITRLCPDLEHLLAAINAIEQEPTEESMEAFASYVELVERMSMASDAVGLPHLKAWFDVLHGCIAGSGGLGLNLSQRSVLSLMPMAVLAYLATPTDASATEGLLDILRGEAWSDAPPVATDLHRLRSALPMVRITREIDSLPARQVQAHPDDVSLSIPDDINQDLLEGLLQELPLQTADFTAAIQHIATGNGTVADIDVAKRAAHTLKGAANTVGIKGIANLTHHVEDIFVALSKHHVLPGRNMAQMLVHAGDCLEAMSEAVAANGPVPDEALDILQEVLDWANRIDHEGIPEDDVPVSTVKQSVEQQPTADLTNPTEPSAPDTTTTAAPATATAATTATSGTSETMVRVSASLIDELLRLVGETIISTGQVRERLQRLEHQNRDIREQNAVFLQLAAKLEEQVDMRSLTGTRTASDEHSADFDPLEFEHYSELHTISRQLIEIATDSNEFSTQVKSELGKLSEVVNTQNRLHDQTQNAMMRLRMLPVSTIVSRLQRSVRQTSRLVNKEVILTVLGAETMVDANILNELVDPLMHMLRNAIDHGIELPEQRLAVGKSSDGHIVLQFLREGNQIVVRCRDDGAGVDLEAVRRKAQNNGLITPDLRIPDDELVRLVLAPGFSTRNEPTQVSGRGVGLDVVYSRVLQLKGGLTLKSNRGQGLEVVLNLPATLISTHALLVMVQTQIFAVSSYGVQDIRYVIPSELQLVGSQKFFRMGNDLLPLMHLDKLLNFPDNQAVDDTRDGGFPALLVKDDTGSLRAVRVQKIMDSRNLVVKGLGQFVPKPHGVVGATILGDGSVVAVIDIPELIRKPTRQIIHQHTGGLQDARGDAVGVRSTTVALRRTAMVVDDSLSARRATVQFMKDAGFEVRSAIDGIEAVDILAKWKPSILLVDMEMPRMNGLELTAHVRAQPDMAHIPIIMITSRSTEKHRSQAKAAGVNVYLTKPFGDDELLEHISELTGT